MGLLAGLVVLALLGAGALYVFNLGASSAIIRFVRTHQDVPVPNSRVVAATDGSGQVAATVEQAATVVVVSDPINAVANPGSAVIFDLTVSNGNRGDQTSPAGFQLTSATNHYTCTTNTAVLVTAFSSASQPCVMTTGPVQADSWSLSETESPFLDYTGRNPAGGASPYYYVPNTTASVL